MSVFEKVKSESLGKRKEGERGHPIQENRTLRRLQAKIDNTSSALLNETAPAKRAQLLKEVSKLKNKKLEAAEKYKRRQYENFLTKLESLDTQKRMLAFWREVKSTMGGKNGSKIPGVVKNKEGILSDSQNSFLENWATFYEELYTSGGNEQFEHFELPVEEEGPQCLNSPPSLEELSNELKITAKNKSPGFDSIRVSEMVSLIDTEAFPLFGKILELFWHLEKIPKALKKIILVPLLKDPDKDIHDCSNYRPIALVSCLLKLYQSILNRRLLKFAEERKLLSDFQFGFRSDRSVVDAHLLLRETVIANKFCKGPRGGRNVKKPIFTAFLDIRKAFDKVPRDLLWKKLWTMGVRGRFLRVIREMHTDVVGCVRLDDLFTRNFRIDSGVVQGSILGPVLFNLFINSLIKDLENSGVPGVQVSSSLSINVLGYADDLALLASSPADLQKLIRICEKWGQNNGLEFAPSKSKILVFHPHQQSKVDSKFEFRLNEITLEKVRSFRYLGIDLDASGALNGPGRSYKTYLKKMLSKAQRRLATIRLLGFHKDGLRITTAVRLYKLLVRPLIEFGAQVICFSKSQIAELEQFQAKALRGLLGLLPAVKAETVLLLAGVEPVACRRHALLLNYFHRLRGSQKSAIGSLLKDQLEEVRLVRCFEAGPGLRTHSEWASRCLSGFAGDVHCALKTYNMLHEFHCGSHEARSKFSAYVKKVTREFHFQAMCTAFDNTRQGLVFKHVTLPMLRAAVPFSGIAINTTIFEGTSRGCRTALLQALSGLHFASEHFCRSFKSSRSTCCPLCSNESRTLEHFVVTCPHFSVPRRALTADVSQLWGPRVPPETGLLNMHFLFGQNCHIKNADFKTRLAVTKRFSIFLETVAQTLNPRQARALS